MTHEQVIEILSEYNPPNLLDGQYDSIANMSQYQLFEEFAQKDDRQALRPFFVNMGTDSDTPPMYVSPLGTAPLPLDYDRVYSFTYNFNGSQVPLELLDHETFDYRKNHPTEYPSKRYPIVNVQSNYIRFLPKDLQYVNFEYLRHPKWVKLATTTTRGYAQYDPANSIEFEWDDSTMAYVIQKILENIGIPATIEQLKQIQKSKQ